jgi:predicted O-methyltransferase YrrM
MSRNGYVNYNSYILSYTGTQNRMKKIKEFIRWHLYKGLYKPGHYYSTIPSMKEVEDNSDIIFRDELPAEINLRLEEQALLIDQLREFEKDFSWPESQKKGYRYYSNNSFFNRADAFVLYGMLRITQPKQLIEIGSGFSSAIMMDVNSSYLNNNLNITFIEPYPDRLKSLMLDEDADRKEYTILPQTIQSVPLSVFKSLAENDILFVDSSHVSKVGSDLNHIIFKILPILPKGVLIHFHDITYPFEYPYDWIKKGIYWNELYLLRAFLMYNTSFEIIIMNNFWKKASPGLLNIGQGGSLWLRKFA